MMVKKGDLVEEGSSLLVMEAMKMENEMKARSPAKIKKFLSKPVTTWKRELLLLNLNFNNPQLPPHRDNQNPLPDNPLH